MSFEHLKLGNKLKIDGVIHELIGRQGAVLACRNVETGASIAHQDRDLVRLYAERRLSIIKMESPLTRPFDDRAFESFSPAVQDEILRRLVYVTACDRLFQCIANKPFVAASPSPADPNRMKPVPPGHFRAKRRRRMARRPGEDGAYALVATLVSYGQRRIAVAEALHRRAARYDASLIRRQHSATSKRMAAPACVETTSQPVPLKDVRPIRRMHEVPREAVSSHALRTWHARWVYSGRKIQALAPQHARKGRKGQAMLDPRVCKLMDRVIKKFYMQPERPPLTLVYDAFRSMVDDKKFKDKSGNPLTPPSYMSLSRRLKATQSRHDMIKAREGEFAAYAKEGPSGIMARTTIPMGLVEIDHTKLDAFVRAEDGKQMARPWLTAVIDVATRMIVGFHLTFEPPSWRSVMNAMRNAMLPKQITGCESTWPIAGIPFAIRMDNGKEFKSLSMIEMGHKLRIDLQWCPPGRPNCKPHIERFFGAVARDFCAREGRSFASADEKGDYQPHTKNLVDLAEITEDFTKWIVDRYHNNPHSGLMFESPLACFERLDQIAIRRPAAEEEVHILTAMVLTGSVSKTGIHYLGLTYRNDTLDKLYKAFRSHPFYKDSALANGQRVGRSRNWELRLDPNDVSQIFVRNPEKDEWETIPCVNDIAKGHTLQSWRVVCTKAKAAISVGQQVPMQTLERVAKAMLTKRKRPPTTATASEPQVDEATLEGTAVPQARARRPGDQHIPNWPDE